MDILFYCIFEFEKKIFLITLLDNGSENNDNVL